MKLLLFIGEIDRCLKKVTEGVEVFEDLWQKVCLYTYVCLYEASGKMCVSVYMHICV